MTTKYKIQLAVIVSDCGATTVGGDVQRTVKLFDIPDELAEFIEKSMSSATTVSFAIHREEESIVAYRLCESKRSETDVLRAEVERLRADAEKWREQRASMTSYDEHY